MTSDLDEAALDARLKAAETLAREAGAMALAAQRRGLSAERKADQSLVTDADGAIERFLQERLAAAFPDDGFFGEEGGGAIDGPTWIVDPIDGTANFADGRPFWCVSIGFYADGAPAIGAVYDPVHDELFHGRATAAPMLNGAPIPPHERLEMGPSATIGFGLARGGDNGRTCAILRDAQERGATLRNFGAAALTLAYVATRRLDGFFTDGLKLWDAAAAMALLVGSGAPCSTGFDLRRPMLGGQVFTAAPGLFDELTAMRDAYRKLGDNG